MSVECEPEVAVRLAALERVLLTRRASLIQEVRGIERELGIKRPAEFGPEDDARDLLSASEVSNRGA